MATDSQLSYFHFVGKEPLRYLTTGQAFEATAIKFPNLEVIVDCEGGRRLTYSDLLEESDRLAAGFLELGVRRGDRLGIWATNSAEWFVTHMACMRGGFCATLINPQYKAKDIEYTINKIGLKFIVCSDKSKHQDFYDVLKEVMPNLEFAKPEDLISQNVPSLKVVVMISNNTYNGTYSYKEVLNFGSEKGIKYIKSSQNAIQADDPCCIFFSSGSTGHPKAVVLNHFQLVNNGYAAGKRAEFDKIYRRILCAVPFFHAFGAIMSTFICINFGATIVVPSATFNPEKCVECIKDELCSAIYGTPTIYSDLINNQLKLKADISPEIAFSAGSPCVDSLVEKIRTVLKVKKITFVYGMTEICIAFHSLLHCEDNSLFSVGYLLDHLEAKVVDAQGNIVPVGVPGELCIRGYSVMGGYYRDDEKSKEIMSDGWLKTGDKFILHSSGRGNVVGRLKEVINRGGENIYPAEVENLLSTHPDIAEAYVVGLPHERLGEEVAAIVKLKEGSTLTFSSMKEYFIKKTAFANIPSRLIIVNDFPKLASVKILKQKLKEMYINKV